MDEFGTSNTAFGSIPLKASDKIVVFLPFNTTFFIDEQCANARLPIFVTLAGIVVPFNPEFGMHRFRSS